MNTTLVPSYVTGTPQDSRYGINLPSSNDIRAGRPDGGDAVATRAFASVGKLSFERVCKRRMREGQERDRERGTGDRER